MGETPGNRAPGAQEQSEHIQDPQALGAWKAAIWFFLNSLDTFLAVKDGVLMNVNPNWEALTGWPAGECVGRPFRDFVHPDDFEAASAKVNAAPQGERAMVEHRLATKSGAWLWVQSHTARGDDGWILVILRDVTEARQREADAEEARRAAAMLRTAARVTIWRYDPEADAYEDNPDFNRPAGRRERSMAGERLRRTIHRGDSLALHVAWERSVETGEAGMLEYRDRVDGGDWRHVRSAWQGVRPMASGRWEIVGVTQDLTELAGARDAAIRGEQAALAAAEAKSHFLANMSHEIRTPMNGVLGVLHLIKREPSKAERLRLIDEALASGSGLADLLNDIIDYSDVEAGRLELKPEACDPAAQLEAVAAMLRPRAEAKGLRMGLSCPPDLGRMMIDPARLRQILGHLMGNAVKFTERGGLIVTLSASGEGQGRRLHIDVADTGVGIPEAAQASLFERFQQADNSSTRRFGGPGLGLAVTRRLAELMDGAVTFTSEEGRGSAFQVQIAAPAAEDSDAEGDGLWLAGLRVLVVEDHPTNRLVATRMLAQLGAEVETAENGAEGVAAVERGAFDLIFMDIQMPVMDGVEATRRIRAMPAPRGQTPIVATTANVLPAQLAGYRSSGINGVVAKPISPSALLAEVARVANDTGEAPADEAVA